MSHFACFFWGQESPKPFYIDFLMSWGGVLCGMALPCACPCGATVYELTYCKITRRGCVDL